VQARSVQLHTAAAASSAVAAQATTRRSAAKTWAPGAQRRAATAHTDAAKRTGKTATREAVRLGKNIGIKRKKKKKKKRQFTQWEEQRLKKNQKKHKKIQQAHDISPPPPIPPFAPFRTWVPLPPPIGTRARRHCIPADGARDRPLLARWRLAAGRKGPAGTVVHGAQHVAHRGRAGRRIAPRGEGQGLAQVASRRHLWRGGLECMGSGLLSLFFFFFFFFFFQPFFFFWRIFDCFFNFFFFSLGLGVAMPAVQFGGVFKLTLRVFIHFSFFCNCHFFFFFFFPPAHTRQPKKTSF
jgi:hypothetical protein